ncbi:MAG: lipoate--protein ligase family protein [Elainellaceae cyanobacterium]
MQMAIDTWLLEQHRQGLHPPTLRFYTWSPIAISVGYHQRQIPDFWHNFTWNHQPIDLVRRPSGGRAVLHQSDLTYAIVTSGMTGNRMQVYQQLCEFLIQGWRSLGVELHYGEAGRGYIHNPNCFGTATTADLVTSDGVKLIGSAQLYRDRAILQHGSMQINTNPLLFQNVFGVEMKSFTLPSSLQDQPMQKIVNALTTSIQQNFGIELVTQPLSMMEWSAIQAIATGLPIA